MACTARRTSRRPPAVRGAGRATRVREVARAAGEQASWVTLSPYAVSASKPGHGPALPPGAFVGHPVPVLALAGIDASNAASARAAGAHGVAVMGAVMRASRPRLRGVEAAGGAAMSAPPVVLAVGGTDSGGAAGLAADLATIGHLGCHAACAVTAVTAQDTTGVHARPPRPARGARRRSSTPSSATSPSQP